jgi:tyrosyl-tRNA synthetase
MDILEDLEWRGLIADCTNREELNRRLTSGSITLYCGFDPTGDSLHIGHLVPLLGLRRFQLGGHSPIALAGGATGMIGDPSGKSAERQLLSLETLASNVEKIKGQLQRFLDFDAALPNPARLLDNASWMAPVSFLDFLREVGRHFTINSMVAKESVRARMEDRDVGISYTEFSYMLLQAYDFYHLNQSMKCELQIGGSDQWGNITAGGELCRKKGGSQVYGLTMPLITRADGQKFGKTESGAIWLDPARTSPYRLFQYFIQVDDRDVIRFLKYFTFLSREEIEQAGQRHQEKPEAREAHRLLAFEVTRIIHGETAAQDAVGASEVLFGGGVENVTEASFNEVVAEVPASEIAGDALGTERSSLVEILALSGLSPSKGQARKDIQQGGIYVNNQRDESVQRVLGTDDLLFGKFILLRKGKKNYHVVKVRS